MSNDMSEALLTADKGLRVERDDGGEGIWVEMVRRPGGRELDWTQVWVRWLSPQEARELGEFLIEVTS